MHINGRLLKQAAVLVNCFHLSNEDKNYFPVSDFFPFLAFPYGMENHISLIGDVKFS